VAWLEETSGARAQLVLPRGYDADLAGRHESVDKPAARVVDQPSFIGRHSNVRWAIGWTRSEALRCSSATRVHQICDGPVQSELPE